MSEHDRQADALEHQAEEMEKRAGRLEDEIDDARKDWERKKDDPSVPGAPEDHDEGDDQPPPEQRYPAKD